MRYNGTNHLAMATGDMDATIRFWRDLLGLRLVANLGEAGYRHCFFENSPKDLIAFFEWPGLEPAKPKGHGAPGKGPHVFEHVSLGVESEEALRRLKAELEAAGFACSDMIDHGYSRSISAFDPNGIPIEFMWIVPGRNARGEPKPGGTQSMPLARQDPAPQAGQ